MIIFTDPHIEDSNIEELDEVFGEISSYKDDRIICGGDYYHKNRLTAGELDFGTKWAISFLKQYGDYIMIEGNHPVKNENESTVRYLSHLGIKLCEEYVTENMYFGHCMTEKSCMFFENSIREDDKYMKLSSVLNQYDLSILGHQHSYEKIDNIYQLGSCIYTTFSEVNQDKKYIAQITNKKLKLIELKSVIPMYDALTLEDLEYLPSRAKVRLVINSFEDFKKYVNTIDKWKKKFYRFKTKLNIEKPKVSKEVINEVEEKKEKKTTQDIVNSWIEKVEDKDVRELLEVEFEEVIGKCG